MTHSAILEMNGLELIGILPSKRILELFLAVMEHCLFIHKPPHTAMEVTLEDIVRDGCYQDFR